jgi:hypothetical protein
MTFCSSLASGQDRPEYGILVDNTRSLEKQFSIVRMFGKTVVERIHERGPISLFSFVWKNHRQELGPIEAPADLREGMGTAEITLGIESSRDESLLEGYINSLSIVGGQTQLDDAIHFMASELNARADADKNSVSEKVIILITDGNQYTPHDDEYDSIWNRRANRLIKELTERGIRVYVVGLIEGLSPYRRMPKVTQRNKAESFLIMITKETGGRVTFPKGKKVDAGLVIKELLP